MSLVVDTLLFPFRRHGQEGRPQADAGVVQTGPGEERTGPLRVGAHDLVSSNVVVDCFGF